MQSLVYINTNKQTNCHSAELCSPQYINTDFFELVHHQQVPLRVYRYCSAYPSISPTFWLVVPFSSLSMQTPIASKDWFLIWVTKALYNRPQLSAGCTQCSNGPMALHRSRQSSDPKHNVAVSAHQKKANSLRCNFMSMQWHYFLLWIYFGSC